MAAVVNAVVTHVYTCARCSWKGENPAIVEDNVETTDPVSHEFSEQLRHTAVCRLCYGPVTGMTIYRNGNVTRFPRG
jgi:hypothetical protein